MPGQQLQTHAFILTRQLSGSDKFEQLNAFSAEHGVLLCLRRVSAGKAASTPLDLFDEAELSLESSNQGRTWFVKDHRFIERHPGIGRSYDALRTASAFGSMLARNPVSDESREAVVALLRSCFTSLAAGGPPRRRVAQNALLLPPRRRLPGETTMVAQALRPRPRRRGARAQPAVAGQTTEPEHVASLTQLLENWLRGETEIRL